MMCGAAHKSHKNCFIIIVLHKCTPFVRWLTNDAINVCNRCFLRIVHVVSRSTDCEVIMNTPIEQSSTLSAAELSNPIGRHRISAIYPNREEAEAGLPVWVVWLAQRLGPMPKAGISR